MRHVSAIFFQQVNAPPGQRTQLRLNGQNQDASYAAGQLIAEHIEQTRPTAHSSSTHYTHDAVGNRTQKVVTGAESYRIDYVYDSNDRLIEERHSQRGSTRYRWDGNGNLSEKAEPAHTTRYQWNSDNRLIKVERGSQSIEYGYDPQGRRIKRLARDGSTRSETHYLLDAERPYHEIVTERTQENSGPWNIRTYLYTPDGVDTLISDSDGTTTRQIYSDGQGSTRLITAGATTHTYSFDAFGTPTHGTAHVSHLYTGEHYDPDTGLIHLRARDYDPKIGRFISMDEHPGERRIPLTLNKYLYGNADPVNHVDPSGYMTVSMSISVNMSSAFRTSSFAAGRRVFKKILFGNPPKDIGLVGELVLDWMTQGFFDHIYDGAITKQEFGRRVHRELRERCLRFKPVNNVTLKCEPFFTQAQGGPLNHNPRGSVGVDVLILYHNSPVVSIELKTGAGMSQDGKRKRMKWSGTTLIQVTINGVKDR